MIGYNPQPGSVLIRAGNPVTARPYDPYVPPDPRLHRRSSWGFRSAPRPKKVVQLILDKLSKEDFL